MTENQTETETTERADLSWLSDVQPTVTTMRTSKRGRQPGKNPVAPHVKSAHESGETLSLPVPAQHARQTERMLRRAALREKWSISVQVLSTDPASATSDDVIALKDLADLPDGTDVWVSFQVRDKEAETESANESGVTRADESGDVDPFAGAPAAGDESGETEPETEPERKPRKGRRSAA